MDNIKKDLEENGYAIVPNVLSTGEVDYCKGEFGDWQSRPNFLCFL